MNTSAHLAFNQLTTITHITQLYWERAGKYKFLFSFFVISFYWPLKAIIPIEKKYAREIPQHFLGWQ